MLATMVVEDAVRPDDWLTTSQVAELLGLNVSTIQNQIRRGKLKATRFGSGEGFSLVRRKDALAYQERVANLSATRQTRARKAFPDGVDAAAKPDFVTDEGWSYLVRHVNDGKSYAEIAEEAGITREGVRNGVERVIFQIGRGRAGRW